MCKYFWILKSRIVSLKILSVKHVRLIRNNTVLRNKERKKWGKKHKKKVIRDSEATPKRITTDAGRKTVLVVCGGFSPKGKTFFV